ncbi:helix-turn-helix transcriptional regulator [Nocardiopsis composta]
MEVRAPLRPGAAGSPEDVPGRARRAEPVVGARRLLGAGRARGGKGRRRDGLRAPLPAPRRPGGRAARGSRRSAPAPAGHPVAGQGPRRPASGADPPGGAGSGRGRALLRGEPFSGGGGFPGRCRRSAVAWPHGHGDERDERIDDAPHAAGQGRPGPGLRRLLGQRPAGAGRAGLPTHLRRSFRSAFGESPHAYLCRRRIERACRLLRSTDLSVTDIARAVGYESLGTFTRRFVRMVGETPTRHRARGPLPGIPSCFAREAARPR